MKNLKVGQQYYFVQKAGCRHFPYYKHSDVLKRELNRLATFEDGVYGVFFSGETKEEGRKLYIPVNDIFDSLEDLAERFGSECAEAFMLLAHVQSLRKAIAKTQDQAEKKVPFNLCRLDDDDFSKLDLIKLQKIANIRSI